MERKLFFGKVDGHHTGRKDCNVYATITLDDGCFRASGTVWNSSRTDLLRAGQCLDSVAEEFPELKNNPVYAEILYLWENYHLNDMHAGTPEQEEFVKEYFNKRGNGYDYKEACDALKEAGLYEVKVDFQDKPYRYGTSWLKQDLPKEIEEEIEKIITDIHPEEICFTSLVKRELKEFAPCGYYSEEELDSVAQNLFRYAKDNGLAWNQTICLEIDSIVRDMSMEER